MGAVGTAFTARQTASASSLGPGIPSSLESLWTLENEEDDTTTCKYNYDQVAAPQSLLLNNQDPFLPPTIKSPPPSSVSDLWSFEGVSNSATEPHWDTEDPFQCINPYEAEGINGYEKSKLSECSKVPIGEEESQLVSRKEKVLEEKVRKNHEK